MSDTAPKDGVVVEGTPQEAPVEGVSVMLDGKEIVADKGELVIAAAERHGVYIPRFCYHPRMESVGMCRMCIVEIDAGRGPTLQPACMLECTDGMKIDTDSEVTKKAQDGVLEFLLINHPLDCPVCDKGGECPLQDQTMAYGPGESRFVEEKRHFEKPIPISDLVFLDRERCILCDRCTRFAKDVAGDPLIHFLHRGNHTEVNTFPDEPFSSYFSGNTVQICPVGALTASSYRFRARPWDLEENESTCQTCAVGCRMAVQSSRDEVLRYVGVDVDPVNWGWLCDKGRYNFQAANSADRVTEPLVRSGDGFETSRWPAAIDLAAGAMRNALDGSGPASIAVVGGARLTNEAAYAWAKLAKGVIGTDNVDCQLGDGLPADVVLGLPKATIDQTCRPGGTVILLGPDLKEELPVLFLRLRHGVTFDKVSVIELSQQITGTSPLANLSLQVRPGTQAEVVRALFDDSVTEAGGVSGATLAEARGLLAAADGPITVVIGRQSVAESPKGVVDAAALLLELAPDVRFLTAVRRGNVHGALDMGLAPGLLPGRVTLDEGREWFASHWASLPDATGLDTGAMLQAAADGRIDTLVLLGADPIGDFPDRDLATRALAGARTVVAVDCFLTESSRRADVVLPAAGFPEVSGTTTNLEGRVSTVTQRTTAPGTAQPDWIVAAEIAHRLGGDLGLESIEDIAAEIERVAPAYAGLTAGFLATTIGSDGVIVPLPGDAGSGSDTEPDGDEGDAVDTDNPVGDADDDDAGDETTGADAAGAADAADAAPALLSFVPSSPADPPALDSYSLRLIATRKLYDQGVLLEHSPTLSRLAPGTVLRVNPYDFGRLGVDEGAVVRITSSRGSVRAEIRVDEGVPRGCAAAFVNQPDVRINELIDASERVTDVRIEREVS